MKFVVIYDCAAGATKCINDLLEVPILYEEVIETILECTVTLHDIKLLARKSCRN
jgi:hypothetical protein